ncbi:hypothetical protein [Salinarimonas soli]|uniref:Uncharacterized protein n=1 Tax=Salinarimonas soli TaxID=1638099 RepID=A0A5B2VBH0_9HYPH|nr:hypothetical protein [Salinarimonas soli]KAA2236421.1 hypothetical protein F0L46_14865 [Salinarimonas soli]
MSDLPAMTEEEFLIELARRRDHLNEALIEAGRRGLEVSVRSDTVWHLHADAVVTTAQLAVVKDLRV